MKPQRIQFVKGALLGQAFSIGETPVLVGRSHESDIRIPGEIAYMDVSRKHVLLINQGDALLVVNMSTGKTLVNGQKMPPNHKVQLVPGMDITLGSGTEFRLLDPTAEVTAVKGSETQDEEERESVPSGPTQATAFGTSVRAETQSPATGMATHPFATGTATKAMPVGPAGSETGAMEADGGVQEEAPFLADEEEPPEKKPDAPPTGTVPGQTVIVSPDELVKLLEANKRARLRKTYKRIGLSVGSFLVIAITYFFMRPHPETELTWQRRGDGKRDDMPVVFDCALGRNAVGALCPRDARIAVRSSSNGVTVVDTYIGRDRDVPLRLKFACEKAEAHLKMSRNELFEKKRRELEESGGWNFLATSPVAFLGPNNGVPYRAAQYLRSEKSASETQQWFGHLIFAVHGNCVLTFTREIPAVEQWRGGPFLARETMLLFGNQVIDGHWEGRPDYRDDAVESMLAEADGLLSLNSPLLWKEAEFLLQSVMIKSGASGTAFDGAHKRLIKLREDQRVEFNRLRALANKEKVFSKARNQASPALDEALCVFSSSDDKRNALLKKGRWE